MDNGFAETFYSERQMTQEKTDSSDKIDKLNESLTKSKLNFDWAQFQKQISNDLSEYVSIKISHDMIQRKLQQRELEVKQLRAEIEELENVKKIDSSRVLLH